MLTEQINFIGRVLVEFAVPMFLQSSVLVVILLLVDLLLKRKVRAVFRYCLWMLILVKLVLPPTLSSPVSLGFLFPTEFPVTQTQEASSTIIQQVILPETIETETFKPISLPAAQNSPRDIELIPMQTQVATAKAVITWEGVVFAGWIFAVVAMFLLLLQRAMFVRGLLAQAQEASGVMNDTFRFCLNQMGMKGKISLKISPNATSSAVCGLFRPVILVPQELGPNVGASQLRMVLLHELAHVKRGDLWVNFAQTLLQIFYFYNPFVWLANWIIRRVREQAVDETVLVMIGEKAAQYPETLVNVAKLAFKKPALSLRLIGVVESRSALAQRIKHILTRPIPKTTKLGIAGLAAVLILGAALLPMARAVDSKSSQDLAAAGAEASQTYIIKFEPKGGFRPRTARELLDAFNSEVNFRVKTHHFRTAVEGNKLVGYILTDGGAEKDAIAQILGTSEKIKFVRGEAGDVESLARHYSMGQPSLSDESDKPVIIRTYPEAFSEDISADLKEITVTFDREMMDGSWSWTGGMEGSVQTTGKPYYDSSKTTCTLPVKLEPGKVYWVGINSVSFKNFKSRDGVPADWYVILFATRDKDGKATAIPQDMLDKAKGINSRAAKKVEDANQAIAAKADGNDIQEQAVESALNWLKLVDKGDYGQSWDDAAGFFKNAVSKEQWRTSVEAARKPLGKVIFRKVLSKMPVKQLPGAPDGEYVVIQFETSFENKVYAIETVTPMLDKDGLWRVSGYYIK